MLCWTLLIISNTLPYLSPPLRVVFLASRVDNHNFHHGPSSPSRRDHSSSLLLLFLPLPSTDSHCRQHHRRDDDLLGSSSVFGKTGCLFNDDPRPCLPPRKTDATLARKTGSSRAASCGKKLLFLPRHSLAFTRPSTLRAYRLHRATLAHADQRQRTNLTRRSIWIACSSGVIIFNKWVLATAKFSKQSPTALPARDTALVSSHPLLLSARFPLPCLLPEISSLTHLAVVPQISVSLPLRNMTPTPLTGFLSVNNLS